MKKVLYLLIIIAFQNICISQNILVENKNENHKEGLEYVLLTPSGKIVKSITGIKIYDEGNYNTDTFERKSTEGLICAYDTITNKMGYLSATTGEWAIQTQFENSPYVHDFFDGLAIIENQPEPGYGKFAVIDTTGKIIVPFCDWTIYDYSDGLAIVEKEGYQFGAIDRTGKLVIPFSVGRLYDFNNGLAIKNNNTEYVDDYSENTGLWGFMDKTGKLVIPQEWSWAEPFYEDLAAVKNKEGKYGFINKEGKLIIECAFKYVQNFSDGFAKIFLPSKIEGFSDISFIDKTGKRVTKKQYSEAQNFKEGLAAVAEINDPENDFEMLKFGFIDTNFNLVIPIQNKRTTAYGTFLKYFSFSDGLCPTSKGFINKNGKLVISFAPFTAMNIEPFENGVAVVALYDSKTKTYRNKLIDKSGKVLWQSVPNRNM
jgi:hypothetical protein